jgi:hypothetical protein
MKPAVWVLVTNYNGAAWLPRCLSSLMATRYPRLHVVLIDNGSSDDSVTVARSVSPQLKILANETNLGFCQGNNAGITPALEQGADYIALLNNDTYVEPDWMDHLVEVGEQAAEVGILGPVQLVFDGQAFNSWMTAALTPAQLETLRTEAGPGYRLPVEWVEGSAMVVKRAVFEAIGLLDPIFFAFFEECDFCRRARAAGFQVALVPASRIHHYRGGSFGQPDHHRQRQFLLRRNALIYNSTDPAATLGRNALRLARFNATQLKAALRAPGGLAMWLRASGAVLARLPALYRKWGADRRRVRGGPRNWVCLV